jgi:cysteine-rich repeat protein
MERQAIFIAALAAVVVAAGCNAVLGIEEGEPRTEPPPESSFCDGKPEGTALPQQTTGDCAAAVCDGYGKAKVIEDLADADDGNPCTQDQCVGSLPTHTPLPEVPCYEGPADTAGVGICEAGIQKCDAQGNPAGGCEGQVLPEVEICATVTVDDDCDGLEDEDGADCTCGDQIVSVGIGEQCDDGATQDADPCSSTCQEQSIEGVSAGPTGTCAWLNGGKGLKCWGANTVGELGLGDTESRGDDPNEMGSALPLLNLGSNAAITSIAIESHKCALFADGSVKCWGFNEDGQLGLGDDKHRGAAAAEMGANLPVVNLGTGKTAKAIAVGGSHTCAILSDDSVKCWGYNGNGQLGLGDPEDRGDGPGEMGDDLPAVNLGSGKTAMAIAAGALFTCALLSDGELKCWGLNFRGQLGLGDTESRGDEGGEMGDNLPTVNLGQGKAAKKIACGNSHTCGVLMDGSVKCWGDNFSGQLGQGDTVHRGDGMSEMGDDLPAVNLGAGKTVQAIATSTSGACALFSGGTVKCWGLNDEGALGLGDILNRGDGLGEMGDALPEVDLGWGKKALALTAGSGHVCALLAEGAIKCWGGGPALGLGDLAPRGDGPNEMGQPLPTVKLFSDSW